MPTARKRYVIHYLNGNLRTTARDGRSLPVLASCPADAVVRVLGGPADPDSWTGAGRFTKWDGRLRARVVDA